MWTFRLCRPDPFTVRWAILYACVVWSTWSETNVDNHSTRFLPMKTVLYICITETIPHHGESCSVCTNTIITIIEQEVWNQIRSNLKLHIRIKSRTNIIFITHKNIASFFLVFNYSLETYIILDQMYPYIKVDHIAQPEGIPHLPSTADFDVPSSGSSILFYFWIKV